MSMVALEGLRPWILQRLTAVYLLLYVFYVAVYWLFFNSFTYNHWLQWLSDDSNQILLSLFYLSMLIHSWVGIRDVLLDYIKPFLLKLLLLFGVALFLIGSGFWLIKILMMVKA
ncbi:MAG: succinate dehydrogenase, hydrophobic membrane anchor protein [Gammaproteobacteria bacterium]|nr:succinate dehydrogenase, hydrophobic membrane anchor protein [Gammaproteobacteria bacterium]